jgi:uncharacterized protein
MLAFLAIVLGIWALLHGYVFWRLASLAWLTTWISPRALALVAVGLWLSFPAVRWLGSRLPSSLEMVLGFAANTWFGVLFLLFVALLAVDVVTLGGWLGASFVPALRTGAVAAAGVCAAIALVQGLRAPVVTEHDVTLPGLPKERDGLRLVAVSDFHLGSTTGEEWLSVRIAQIDALRPDVVAIVGDLVDHNPVPVEALRSSLQRLRAPLGVWAVTGNHEHYAGLERCNALLAEVGFNVLHDRAAEVVPGLVIAGVDDLSARARSSANPAASPIDAALRGRPPGATILLSHSPLQAEAAAAAGAGLMLSGHTHNGQIWPFNFLVRLHYPRIVGRYAVGGMTLIVGRGTGTWGPRMRLWQRGEILLLRLRSAG